MAAGLLKLCGLNPKLWKNNYLHLWNNPLRSEAQTGNRLLPAQMPRERHTLRRHAYVNIAILVSDSLGGRLMSTRPDKTSQPCLV